MSVRDSVTVVIVAAPLKLPPRPLLIFKTAQAEGPFNLNPHVAGPVGLVVNREQSNAAEGKCFLRDIYSAFIDTYSDLFLLSGPVACRLGVKLSPYEQKLLAGGRVFTWPHFPCWAEG